MPSPQYKRQQQRAAREKRRGMQSSRATQPSPTGPSDNAVVGSSAPAFPSSPPRHHNKTRRSSGQSDGSPCGSLYHSPTLCEQKVELRRRSSLVPLDTPTTTKKTSMGGGVAGVTTAGAVSVVHSQFKAFREDSIPCDEVVDEVVSTVSTGSSDEDEVVILESCGRGSLAGFGSQLASGFGRFPSSGAVTGGIGMPPPSSGATSRTHSTIISSAVATPRRVSFSTVIDDGEFVDDLENDLGSDEDTLTQATRSTKLTEELLAALKSVSHTTAAATRSRRRSSTKQAQIPPNHHQHGTDRRRRMSGRSSSGVVLEGTSPRQQQQQGQQQVCRTQSSDHPPRIGTAASKTRLPFQQLSPRRLSNPFPSTARSACAKPPADPSVRPKPTLVSGYNNGLSRKSSNPLIIDCPSGRFSGGTTTTTNENLPPHSGRAMHDVFI